MFSVIGCLTSAGLTVLLICVMVMAWWDIFMTSSDPVDILIGLTILGIWCLGGYIGIRKAKAEIADGRWG